MKRPIVSTLLLLFLGLFPAPAQEDHAAIEAKLRDSLRGAMLQLRNVEAERARLDAELQALKIQSERQIKDLENRLAAAVKKADEDRSAADKKIAEGEKKLTEEKARTAAFAAALDKWKASHIQITEIARAKEAERARLLDKTLRLENTVADRERKNLELYQTGKEILERYENYAFGRALLAREPFTGIAKVRLEEQVQDYKDKLEDGTVREGSPPSAPASPSAAPSDTVPAPPAP